MDQLSQWAKTGKGRTLTNWRQEVSRGKHSGREAMHSQAEDRELGPSGKSEKNLERLNLGLACLMLAKPK